MFANRFMASVIGIALGVTGAVAITHSPAETHINNSFSEAKPLDAECQKMEWPYAPSEAIKMIEKLGSGLHSPNHR